MDAASPSPLTAFRTIAADIKIAHSVFALPFAILAAFMAAAPAGAQSIVWSRFGGQLVLIVLAMVFARTVAMLANRILDRRLDERNPRTASRAIPSGRLTVKAAVAALLFNTLLFMGVCAAFGALYANWWPLILGLPVLAWISAYPLFKRFTSLCHLYLGSSLAISPLAAAIAIDPTSVTRQPAIWLLSGMVFGWVAGFDVIYALQDVDVDREQGNFSLPSRLGIRGALAISRVLHVAAIACLAIASALDERFRVLFTIGVVIVAALLVVEHATVARWGTTRIAVAFFALNGVISCVLGILGVVDVLV